MKASHSAFVQSDVSVRLHDHGDDTATAVVSITSPAPPERLHIRLAGTFPLCDLLVIAAMAYLFVLSVRDGLIEQVDAWLLTGDRRKVDRFMNRCGAAVMTIFVLYVSFAMFTAWKSGVFDRLVR